MHRVIECLDWRARIIEDGVSKYSFVIGQWSMMFNISDVAAKTKAFAFAFVHKIMN